MKKRIIALLLACTVCMTNANFIYSERFFATEMNDTIQEIVESEVSSEVMEPESEILDDVIQQEVSESVSEMTGNIQQEEVMIIADTSTDYEYRLNSSTKKITITKYTGSESVVTIPTTIDGYKVVSIGSSAFSECESLTEVTISETVETIEGNAFYGCENLTKVTLSSKVESIGYSAFSNCKSLTEITIPGNVESIGGYAFSNCENLKNITLNAGLKTIGYYFIDGTAIEEIVIPKTVESMSGALTNAEKLTKVTFAEGMKTIPSGALSKYYYYNEMSAVTEVIIPSSVTTIGSSAFSDCDNLTSITLPSGLEIIQRGAFSDCDGLTSMTLPDALETIESSAFSYCRNLESINIPKKVESIGDYAFQGCESLTEITIPGNVETIGAYAFSNCEDLTSITLNTGLKDIGYRFIEGTAITEIIIPKTVENMAYAFSNAEELLKVTFAPGMTYIPSRALCRYYSSDEWNITEVFVPASVLEVGYGAFDSFEGTLNLASEDSGAAIYAIDNEMTYIAKNKGISDKADGILARNKTSYTTTLSGSTTSGYVNLSLEYALKNGDLSDISNMQLKIKLPSAAELVTDTFKVDGKVYGASMDEDGYIYIPVDNTEGKVVFSVKVSNVSYLMTYAQLEYDYDWESKTEIIGIVDMGQDIFTLSVPDETSTTSIDILGFTNPQQKVAIYLEDSKVAEVTASKTGSYSTTITLSNAEEGTFYKIEAKTTNNEKENSVIAYTKYTQNAVTLTECMMYFRQQSYDLLKLSGQRPVITWVGNNKFTFRVAFDDNDSVDDVTIVSTKNGEVKKLKATWNETQNAFIAAGFADYVPGNITVEYSRAMGETFKNGKVEIGALYEEDEKTGYESKVTLEDIPEFYFLKEMEENISAIPEGDFEQIEYEGSVCYLLNEDKYVTQNGRLYSCEELYMAQEDGTYTLLRTGIGVEEALVRGSAEKETFDKLKTLVELLTDVSEDTEESEIYVLLDKTITTAQESFDSSSSEYWELNMLKTELETAKLVMDTKEAFKKINKVISNASDFSNDPDILPSDYIADEMEEAVDAMNDCAQNVSNNMFRKIMEKLSKKGLFKESLIEKSLKILAEEAEKGGVSFNAKYSIDPSGYIYEAVTDNRIQDAVTTIYYKDPETGDAVLWYAEEYDQVNPLYTDKDGCYAWDVPEGLWQVKVEKEGYETTYSEWLPVPPPQLDVNLALVSKEAPKIESFVVHSDYASLVFSKYMKPETVASIKLTDANGNTIAFTLEYNKESLSAEGVNFAKEYILRFENVTLEPDTNCTISTDNTLKSYVDISMEAAKSTVQVQKNTEIVAPDEVTVKMGTDLEIPVSIVNGKEEMKISAVSSFDAIASVKEIEAGTITVSGNMYGDAEITLTIAGTDVKKVIKVTVDKVSQEVEIEQTVTLPQAAYTISIGETVEIIPQVYPNASLMGTWTVEGSEGIVSVENNTFTAKKEGEVTARYTIQLANGDTIFAECTITIESQVKYGDVNGDGRINVTDLLTVLHGISGSQTLNESQKLAADIDKDGNVTVRDMLRIMHYISGASTTL